MLVGESCLTTELLDQISLGTRLRNPERLRNNLQYRDQLQEAEQNENSFQTETTELLLEALAAFSRYEEEEEGEAEEVEEEFVFDDELILADEFDRNE